LKPIRDEPTIDRTNADTPLLRLQRPSSAAAAGSVEATIVSIVCDRGDRYLFTGAFPG
jgi:hypothetical protein